MAPEMTLLVPAVEPPTTLFGEFVIQTPVPWLPRAERPSAVVPIRLFTTVLPAAPTPSIRIPSNPAEPFPEIRLLKLPAAATPILLFAVNTQIPIPALAAAAEPVELVPM